MRTNNDDHEVRGLNTYVVFSLVLFLAISAFSFGRGRTGLMSPIHSDQSQDAIVSSMEPLEMASHWNKYASGLTGSDQRTCHSLPEWTLTAWRSVLRTCGLNSSIALLVEGLNQPSVVLPHDLTEEFIRPIALAIPDLHLLEKLSVVGQTVFFAEPEIKNADAGRCFLVQETSEQSAPKVFHCLPSLIIIGFQKGGTRELFEWIQTHPNVKGYGSSLGVGVETHYFDSLPESLPFHQLQPNQRKGSIESLDVTWDKVYLNESPKFALDEVLLSRFLFEKTPAYADETDPKLIRTLLPNVRMMASLREPAVRLWSWYWMRCRPRVPCSVHNFVNRILEPAERCGLGYRIITTESQLQLGMTNCLNNNEFPSGYELRAVLLGYYEVYLRRFERAFQGTKASMLITFVESLMAEPFQVMEDIESHSDLDKFDYASIARLDPKSKLYVVSNTSKALHLKPPQYVKYQDLPQDIRYRIEGLYRTSLNSLKSYLAAPSKFLILSRARPAWYERII